MVGAGLLVVAFGAVVVLFLIAMVDRDRARRLRVKRRREARKRRE